jgi:general secretion pathway protein A
VYADYYHLKGAPFHSTPDAALLFLSPSHRAALQAILDGIAERQGLVAILGEGGLGKTTVLRAALARLGPQRVKTIMIVQPTLSFRDVLAHMYQAFGLAVITDDPEQMVYHLYQVLLEEYQQGRHVVLCIDEAQHLRLRGKPNRQRS